GTQSDVPVGEGRPKDAAVACRSIGKSSDVVLNVPEGPRYPSTPLARPPRASAAPPQTLAQLEWRVPDGAAVSAVPRGGRGHGDDSRRRPCGRLELPHLPQPDSRDGARPRRQGAGHVSRRREPRRRAPQRGSPTPGNALLTVAARRAASERRCISENRAPIG